MCATCGCGDEQKPVVVNMQTGKTHPVDNHDHSNEHEHEHGQGHIHSDEHAHFHKHSHGYDHDHDHGHGHAHDHEHPAKGSTTVLLETKILEKNDRLAERNRGFFAALNILALNLVSSPGSGKTTLLERTINDLKGELQISVIEGDQATLNDAARIKKTGARVIQINTGAGCHLDAEMLAAGVKQLDPVKDSLVMIENVGNLVCPALFDLGERCKVAVLSVTEGEDKPVKYPHMFRAAEILLLNKIDLLPHLDFDLEACKQYALSVNPKIEIFEVSAKNGEGLDLWYDWIKKQVRQPQAQK